MIKILRVSIQDLMSSYGSTSLCTGIQVDISDLKNKIDFKEAVLREITKELDRYALDEVWNAIELSK